MQNVSWLKAGSRNFALLLVGFLPLFLLLAGIFAKLGSIVSPGDILGTAFVLYPGLLAPVLSGGFLYLVCIFVVAGRLSSKPRAIAVAFTPLIPVGFLFFGMGYILRLPHFLLALALSLIAYGLVVTIPSPGSGYSSPEL